MADEPIRVYVRVDDLQKLLRLGRITGEDLVFEASKRLIQDDPTSRRRFRSETEAANELLLLIERLDEEFNRNEVYV